MKGHNLKQWDVFISYASEDREAVARPLAALLRELGVTVWFDQTEPVVAILTSELRRHLETNDVT